MLLNQCEIRFVEIAVQSFSLWTAQKANDNASFYCEPIGRVERFQSRGISLANTQEKSSTLTGLVWDTNIAAVVVVWVTE